MARTIYAQEAWPGVFRLVAPFDRSLNAFLKEGFRWFDYVLRVGPRAWYLPEERLNEITEWGKRHDYEVVVHYLSPIRCPEPTQLPLNFHQTMAHRRALRERALILQWPTGAGKSLVAIALSQHVHRTLIVAPRTVVPNWVAEYAKWCPDIEVTDIRPSRKLPAEQPTTLVCSYGTLGKLPIAWHYDLIVYDELHNTMHSTSQRTQRAVSLSLDNPKAIRLGMTGTPVSTKLYDYWQQLHTICPHRYGTRNQWQDRFHVVTRDGYMGARQVGALREDAKEEYIETIEGVVDIIGQDEIAKLYPPVRWGKITLQNTGKASAPKNLKAWQAEQTRNAARRVAALSTHGIPTDRPYAIVTYLKDTALRAAKAFQIPLITGEMPAHKRVELLREAPAFVATMMAINEGLSLPRFTNVYILESYPVPRFVEQVCGRFVRAYATAPVQITFCQLAGTSDDIITYRLCERLREQDALYRSGEIRRGMQDTLTLNVNSEEFLQGLHESLAGPANEEENEWE